MIRVLLTVLAAALAVPAAAQEESWPRLDGLWQGTVADMPVRVCFDWRDWRTQPDLLGMYYYDDVRQLIRLDDEGDLLRERVGHGGSAGASWQFTRIEDDVLEADFGSGQGPRPIRLTRVPLEPNSERDNPCESAEFMGPIFASGAVEEVAATFGDMPYTRLLFRPPAPFRAQEPEFANVAIETFSIPATLEGDRAINAVLATHLPRGSLDDAYAECLIGSAAWNGVMGDWSLHVRPELVSARWLGVLETRSLYCGGAHPSYWERRRVFDRRSGREIEPVSWFSQRGFTRQAEGRGDMAYLRVEMTEELRGVVQAHWPQGDDYEPDCIFAAESAFGWDIGLVEDGIAFIPSVPHVAAMCAYTVVAPWNDVEPFLSAEGREVMLSLAP